MHITYHTDGIVLGGSNIGEGHRMLLILTRDFGMVRAIARSVREERSKLRYSLQPFVCSQISLVLGKEDWRITGAQEEVNFYGALCDDREKVLFLSRFGSLVRRLVQGEEKNKELYETIERGLHFLKDNALTKEQIEDIEHLLVLRVLYVLGYVSKQGALESYLDSAQLANELLEEVTPQKRAIRTAINRALREAHL